MNRSEIYASIVKDVAERLRTSGLIQSDDDLNDIKDSADDGNFTGIFNNVGNKDIFSKITDFISDWDGSESSISCGSNFYICQVPDGNNHYFKDIGVYDDNAKFLCVSAKTLSNFQNSIEVKDMRIIERIWSSIDTDPTNKDSFWQLVRNGGANRYLLVTDETPADADSE